MVWSAPNWTAKVALLRRRGGGDHPRAHQLADLNGGDADAAGRPQHQQYLALAQRRTGIQRVKPGQIIGLKRCAGLEGNLRRQVLERR